MAKLDPTQRFSDRVENYVKYRPGYPVPILDLMSREMGLTPRSVLADIGSGTGISSRLFLENGVFVYGIEPNADMRAAAERDLAGYSQFRSVDGRAEATTLPNRSVDIITALQAFHWFDRPAARCEFLRVLRPGGALMLVWNERRAGGTGFLRDYEHLVLKYADEYQAVRHENIDPNAMGEVFGPAGFRSAQFDNHQTFDFTSLLGRVLSSSYMPNKGDPRYQGMLDDLSRLFAMHALDGTVRFDYDTRVYYGTLG